VSEYLTLSEHPTIGYIILAVQGRCPVCGCWIIHNILQSKIDDDDYEAVCGECKNTIRLIIEQRDLEINRDKLITF